MPAAAYATAGDSSRQSAEATSMTVSLDSCRNMALQSNKQLLIRNEAVNAAHFDNRAAFAAYLPSIDFAGGYTYNQKKISIFEDRKSTRQNSSHW